MGDLAYEEWDSADLMRDVFEDAAAVYNEKYERAMRAFEGVRGGDSQAKVGISTRPNDIESLLSLSRSDVQSQAYESRLRHAALLSLLMCIAGMMPVDVGNILTLGVQLRRFEQIFVR
ncbi:hypothetical protein J3458_020276 [Metarhizium acridum]|uniref:uncharacterized protein n=1 Tax=Metarhizium acridum TaxID=92637 RepID=UPI001C6BE99E|nr:hypothetical protein J3458_020276 [Metarhizium acridum]